MFRTSLNSYRSPIHHQPSPTRSPKTRTGTARLRRRDGGRNSKEKEGSLSATPGDAHDFAAHRSLWSDYFNIQGQRHLPLPRPHGRTRVLDV
jgi:hypothetical protein